MVKLILIASLIPAAAFDYLIIGSSGLLELRLFLRGFTEWLTQRSPSLDSLFWVYSISITLLISISPYRYKTVTVLITKGSLWALELTVVFIGHKP